MTCLEFYEELAHRAAVQSLTLDNCDMRRIEDPAALRVQIIFMVKGREFCRAMEYMDGYDDVEWVKPLGEPDLQFKGINKWRTP